MVEDKHNVLAVGVRISILSFNFGGVDSWFCLLDFTDDFSSCSLLLRFSSSWFLVFLMLVLSCPSLDSVFGLSCLRVLPSVCVKFMCLSVSHILP